MFELLAKIKTKLKKEKVWAFKTRMEILVVVIAISLFVIIIFDRQKFNDFTQIIAVFLATILVIYLLRENNE